MDSILKYLYLLGLFHNIIENCDAFEIIFGTIDGKLLKKTSTRTTDYTVINGFRSSITSLARYGDYLFIGVRNSDPDTESNDSYMWRMLFDSNSSNYIRENLPFNVVGLTGVRILSMVTVKNQIYVGRSDGVLWRCSPDARDNCEIYYGGFGKIRGVGYDSKNDEIYVSMNSHLMRCSPTGTCRSVYMNEESYLTAVNVAFNSIWLGTKNGPLLKCPLITEGDVQCYEFDKPIWSLIKLSRATITHIDSKDGYLYASLTRNDMWRCNPNVTESCGTVFEIPEDTRSFIVGN